MYVNAVGDYFTWMVDNAQRYKLVHRYLEDVRYDANELYTIPVPEI